jgi:Cof subfamily protein (haloacid dehalogenase superfamily)
MPWRWPGAPPAGVRSSVPVPRRPLLVATDLDGTLLRSDGTVSDRTRAAMRSVAAHGVATVLVTARPPRWLHGLADVVGQHGTAVCANGAFVYHVAQRRVVTSRTIDAGLLGDVVAELRGGIPDIRFAAERASGLAVEDAFLTANDYPEEAVRCDDVQALRDDDVGKLLARCPGMPEADFLAAVEQVVGQRLVMAFSGAGGLAELSAAGVTKAAGLAEWAAVLGIGAADVWAFGDMPNDLPMLRWAGTSFAVANAHAGVRAAADWTCPANDEYGVASVLETLIG